MTPTWQSEDGAIQLYHGDCLEILPGLGKVDCVVTDPPYGLTNNEWDKELDLQSFWEKINELTKEKSPVVMFSMQPFTAKLILSNLEAFRYELIWSKNVATGFLNANKRPLVAHENIVIFSQNPGATYNPQKRSGTIHKIGGNDRGSSNYGSFRCLEKVDSDEYFPQSVLLFNCTGTRAITYKQRPNKRKTHPTEKPEKLMAYLCNTYSNPGDLILDPFAGSSTTAIAAIRTGRRFIGIEIDKGYFDISVKRIEGELANPPLFKPAQMTGKVRQTGIFDEKP